MVYKNYWMRNQSPENGSSQVPWHLHAEWQEVSQQVRDASEELEKIDTLYRETLLARISLGVMADDSVSWETIKEERNQAQKKHLAAMTVRMNFTRKVNGEL